MPMALLRRAEPEAAPHFGSMVSDNPLFFRRLFLPSAFSTGQDDPARTKGTRDNDVDEKLRTDHP